REVHMADRTFLARLIAHDEWVHRAEILNVRAGHFCLAGRSCPFFVIRGERIPKRDEAAGGDEDHHKAQASLNRFDDQPDLACDSRTASALVTAIGHDDTPMCGTLGGMKRR